MRQYIKAFLFVFLLGCTFQPSPLVPYAEQLASKNEKVEYTAKFQYSLKDCEGPLDSALNNYLSGEFLAFSVSIDRSRVEFIRYDRDRKLIGHWNPSDQIISRITSVGNSWGITEIEDWRNAIGVMSLEQDRVSGQIRNIIISKEGTFCEVEFKFSGAANI